MRSTRDLVQALPAAAVVLMLCGCSARPAPESATLDIYPLHHAGAGLEMAIEIRNTSRRNMTFIAPQEGSLSSLNEPKYVFDIVDETGKTYPPCPIFYEPPETTYDEYTIITLAPGESLYALEKPWGISGEHKLNVSLTYSCSPIAEPPKWQYKKGSSWPKDLFLGTLKSSSVTVDLSVPLPRETEFTWDSIPDSDIPSAGATENGLALILYPARTKFQQWRSMIAAILILNRSSTPVPLKGWGLRCNWYDASGQKVPTCKYTHWWGARGEYLPPGPLKDQLFLLDHPIGFQKKVGCYKVTIDLTRDKKRLATSNAIDVEIIPNPLLAEPQTNAPPGAPAGGR